ncbi:8-oxo-dGTP pyrophosphatase MutT (NUDIX family) [Solibacillus kalamii]|uniref:DNA mismatch repair protein MutT n=1 Tax=Solibacillus kalamii TaxID=1748298 RepID=A0ABX3ZHD7_9BACL|nr:NUDIX hydrolase [Solibacillus kalamii]MBM7663604.1 8-oxo-dGTP pyrophosphatase MutT (NUDIX family) [Solibacillus kalamii]OUZ39136.1 DNA mismatch repair protein MutT [Solibacillus kalamii]
MKKGIIRPLVICIFRNDESILVAEGYDPVKDEYYYRPIGGGIEYGEKSAEALIREVREEIEADIINLKYLGTVENIFTFSGEVGHEIVQVYDAAFVDTSFYTEELCEGKEDDGKIFKIMRIPISKFQNGELRLVPEGLLDLI